MQASHLWYTLASQGKYQSTRTISGTAADKEAVTERLAIFSLIRERLFEKAHHLSGFPGTMAMFYKLVQVLLGKLSFLTAMASGSLAAMAIFESVMKDFLTGQVFHRQLFCHISYSTEPRNFLEKSFAGKLRQTVVPLEALDEKCILESEMVSHFELESVHIIPSFAGLATSSVCKQKYVPFTDSIFWGV
ncbi:hypothetical protein POTOM_037479 [Populus tomentosa]|uniref:Uncharacterized protein n=1 Tax=Populus tomentosa TaxID=118781 RepID=A0A8X8CCL3_POPTO|nr:hypothetical protein POTOM_037479 [Populus tomentosa]